MATWQLPQRVWLSNLKKAYNSYKKIMNYHAKMMANEERLGAAFRAGPAVVELNRLEQANNKLTANLARRYGIPQHEVYVNLMRIFPGFNAQQRIARNAAHAGSHRIARNAFKRANVTRELTSMIYNPERIRRRPYARSMSPRKSPRSPLRRTSSAPLNRPKPRTPQPHKRVTTMRNFKKLTSESLRLMPSGVKRARTNAGRP
jgi:hypothetical protein